ncbi:MAG: SLC13 family permease [Anaerolineales bacterium]|nr:SLC13 family permease [Anaerolineales bacterium]
MSFQILFTLTVLGIAVVLFISERLRVDLIALLVLSALALMGLVTPSEALSGFSNPAVITIWAVFIIGGGLSKTGMGNIIGRQLLRLAGPGEARLIVLIMLTTGLLSGFMNNIGVAALLLPVVMDIARQTGRPPSKLLMPLAFGSLLGGLMTQIGTPPNILISSALEENGLYAFGMFDYTPIGSIIMLTGVVFMALVGRHLLPVRDPAKAIKGATAAELGSMYDLEGNLFLLRLPQDSPLDGQTLAECRFGAVLGLNVTAIIRDDQPNLAPQPDDLLREGDQLLVTGMADQFVSLQNQHPLQLEHQEMPIDQVMTSEVIYAELKLTPDFDHLGQTLQQLDFRRKYDLMVMAIWRQDEVISTEIEIFPVEVGDVLLVHGSRGCIAAMEEIRGISVSEAEKDRVSWLYNHLMTVRIPSESSLVGVTLAESRLAEAFGLAVLAIVREDATQLMPTAEERLQANDIIFVRGESENLLTLYDLRELQISQEDTPDPSQLESPRVGLVEAVLSPHTTLIGKSLHQLHFREKYGLNVLAIWRGGEPYRAGLRDMKLRFGDAFLLHGPRSKLKMLASDADFLVLAEDIQEEPKRKKMPLALLILAGVLIPTILGWLPIYISAIVGAALMVLTGCLTMDEAYRFIEWKAVFLIAGMLPLGIAMEQTGTARFLAEGVISLVGPLGPMAILAALFILSTLASQIMPNAAAAVLLAPIALTTAADMGISPYPLMMAVAISASAAFLSPVAHPSNVLVLGPGGYRLRDYLKVGIPLTLLVMVVTLLVLPIFWPL